MKRRVCGRGRCKELVAKQRGFLGLEKKEVRGRGVGVVWREGGREVEWGGGFGGRGEEWEVIERNFTFMGWGFGGCCIAEVLNV